MGKQFHIYSTSSNDTAYGIYRSGKDGAPNELQSKVVIKGGSGVANKNLITPIGVRTTVSEDEMSLLKECPAFQRHVEAGFQTISKSKEDAEVVAADMVGRDGSAPRVDADFGETAPTVAAPAQPAK